VAGFKKISLIVFLLLLKSSLLLAQAAPPPASSLPALTGQQKRILLLIAREALNAALENRAPREPRVGPRLEVSQPMVVSLYVDKKLRSRAWKLKSTLPLYQEASALTAAAISRPAGNFAPLRPEELARAEISLAVLTNYSRANDDREVPPRAAVIIYNGFTEHLALPGDIESNKAADLLSHACQEAGLRPQAWLLPETVIFSARVEELREGFF
jgi:AMMECR1 domain-containing protein